MRVIFMGTPDFSVPALTEILAHGHDVPAVYTRAPKPGGRRGLEYVPSPVHAAAQRSGIEVLTPKTLRNDDAPHILSAFKPDVAVVAAYGLILPKAVLDVPEAGCLNLHASLLPRWRGAAPIQRAIMAGDRETGVMVMRMEEGLDTGPVSLTEQVPIPPDATGGEMHDHLARLGADLIVRALAALERGTLAFTPQTEEGIIYAHKIDKAEARIAWTRPARDLHNLIRALSPFPGAYFEADLGKGVERVKVLRTQVTEGFGAPGLILDDLLTIACGEGALRLTQVQKAGKTPMGSDEFLRGARLHPGTLLAAL